MKAVPNQKKTVMMLIIHAIITVITAYTAITGILYGASSSQDGDNMIGLGYFQAFTMDINILTGVCALITVCVIIRALLKKKNTMPAWAVVFQHVTATGLLLTMVTVVFFLAPMDALDGKSYWDMFSNDLFVFHLINPVLSVFSFIFLQDQYRLKGKEHLWSMLPLAVYGIIYFLMVVVFKQWSDFYGFSFGGRYYLAPLVIAFMLFLNDVLGRLLVRMNGKRC